MWEQLNQRAMEIALEFVGERNKLYDAIVAAIQDAYTSGYSVGYADARWIWAGAAEQPDADFDGFYAVDDVPEEAHSVDTLPPMQEQKTNPFAWAPGPSWQGHNP